MTPASVWESLPIPPELLDLPKADRAALIASRLEHRLLATPSSGNTHAQQQQRRSCYDDRLREWRSLGLAAHMRVATLTATYTAARAGSGSALLVLWPCPVIAATFRHSTNTGRLERIRARLLRCECPGCGFDLNGSPALTDAMPAWRGLRCPSNCPECGTPWPLVPPSISDWR